MATILSFTRTVGISVRTVAISGRTVAISVRTVVHRACCPMCETPKYSWRVDYPGLIDQNLCAIR